MNLSAIEQSVLGLPEVERAPLVHFLLDSLDAPWVAKIQAIWLNEACGRADDIDAGNVNLASGKLFGQQVQALFR